MGRTPKSEEPVYRRLESMRTDRGITRQQLADAVEVHYQTVGYLERGEHSPSLALALCIARSLTLRSGNCSHPHHSQDREDPMSTSRRTKNEQLVAARTERLMTDTRFQALRTPRARIALAVAMIALFVVIPAAWILLGSIAGVVAGLRRVRRRPRLLEHHTQLQRPDGDLLDDRSRGTEHPVDRARTPRPGTAAVDRVATWSTRHQPLDD